MKIASAALLLLVGVAANSHAAPISWSEIQFGNNQLLSSGQSVELTFDVNGSIDTSADTIESFDFTWTIRDNDPDVVMWWGWVQTGTDCRRGGRSCTPIYEWRRSTRPGATETAGISTSGYESGSFAVGRTCSGDACTFASVWEVVHSFSNVPESLHQLQTTGLFRVTLTALTGDFFVGNASLNVYGTRGELSSVSVNEPRTFALLLAGVVGLVLLRRRWSPSGQHDEETG